MKVLFVLLFAVVSSVIGMDDHDKQPPGCPVIEPGTVGICAFTCPVPDNTIASGVTSGNECVGGQVCCWTACGGSSCVQRECPQDKPKVNCLVDPCRSATCPMFTNAVCRSNYCGGCNFDFFDGRMKLTSEQCLGTEHGCPQTLPTDSDCIQTCPLRPSDTDSGTECSLGKVCCPTSCGTTCREPECPPDKPVASCIADPCSVNKCLKYPDADCIASYCGGCNADFYYMRRKLTPRDCVVSSGHVNAPSSIVYLVLTAIVTSAVALRGMFSG